MKLHSIRIYNTLKNDDRLFNSYGKRTLGISSSTDEGATPVREASCRMDERAEENGAGIALYMAEKDIHQKKCGRFAKSNQTMEI